MSSELRDPATPEIGTPSGNPIEHSPLIDDQSELDRLRRFYEGRKDPAIQDRYSRLNPGHLFGLHEREATMAKLFRAAGIKSLAGMRILDVGCGSGSTLRQYLEYGAASSQLSGIELSPWLAQQARSSVDGLRVICGNATALPFADRSFDFASQFALFTSVLKPDMKVRIACEIDRVLVPGGRLLWYDFAYDNPSNPNVKGIKLAEVRRLFPGFSMSNRRITLAPPLGRAIGRLGPTVYFFASKMRFLCTHYLCLLQKPRSVA